MGCFDTCIYTYVLYILYIYPLGSSRIPPLEEERHLQSALEVDILIPRRIYVLLCIMAMMKL